MSATATSVTIAGTNTAGTGSVAVSVFGTNPACIATAVGSTAPGPPAKPSACTAAISW